MLRGSAMRWNIVDALVFSQRLVWALRHALVEAVGKDPVPELPAIVADLRDVA